MEPLKLQKHRHDMISGKILPSQTKVIENQWEYPIWGKKKTLINNSVGVPKHIQLSPDQSQAQCP